MISSDVILPMHKKDLLPPNRRDRSLFIFMVVGIPFAVLWEGCVVLPNYHTHFSTIVLIHFLASCFIVFNIFGNMYLLKRVDASGKQKSLPAILKQEWRYCHLCELNSPPRSYHCPICNECILKRDHHCMFVGCCVGYHNQRYYLLTILYIWIGAIYGVSYQWDYCFQHLGGLRPGSVLILIAPHFAWVFGAVSSFGFLVAVLHTLGIVVLVVTSYLLLIQLLVILYGQTQYERKHNIESYNLGFKCNLLDVLGTRWYFVWLFPWIPSTQNGDGLHFFNVSDLENVKNI
ncbi:probable palmitoyltransferase ZDHHC24 [Limulus polyphemus]|uniref:Palmitoyltransferase n=1 Tax=Limulus polyphemus TaxID=6850 RepID=A0ABM1BLA2_LIMPO|nr:probable palmitoyltransferase ZDHHC24 [Limulus polyphemus]